MTAPSMINVKFAGGPLSGQTLDLPRNTERWYVGGQARLWTYIYGGKVGAQVYFALWPRDRAMQRFILTQIRQTGRHPHVERDMNKRLPYRKPKAA